MREREREDGEYVGKKTSYKIEMEVSDISQKKTFQQFLECVLYIYIYNIDILFKNFSDIVYQHHHL